MAAPTYPAAANLTEGTGTRSFTALSTNAGDWIVVGVSVESNGPTQSGHNVPTATGLTFTQQVASGTEADPGAHQRIFFFTAQDSSGGSRTVQVNPTGSFNYYARATVVRGSAGPGNSGSAMTAQTFSLTRSGANSGLFIQVGDWSAGAVGSPSWTPGGSTTASQQGTFGTYIFGRFDDAGGAGSSTTGISSPSYTTPTSGALEMLGTADAAGVASARPGRTWMRRFHHREIPLLGSIAAVDVRSETAESQLGLSADSIVSKVAVVSAISSLGLGGTVTAKKVAPAAGSGAVGLAANAVHVDVRAVTAFATIGLGSTVTAKKVTPTVSPGTIGLAGTVTARKVTPATLRSTVGLTGFVTARKVAPATGLGTIGLQASFAHVEIHPITALATLGATAYLTGKKRSIPLVAGTIGLTGNALPKKISKSIGVGVLPLTGQAVTVKRQAITGRSPLGLATYWNKSITGLVAYVEVIGTSTAGAIGAGSVSGSVEATSQGGTISGGSVSGSVEAATVATGQPS